MESRTLYKAPCNMSHTIMPAASRVCDSSRSTKILNVIDLLVVYVFVFTQSSTIFQESLVFIEIFERTLFGHILFKERNMRETIVILSQIRK